MRSKMPGLFLRAAAIGLAALLAAEAGSEGPGDALIEPLKHLRKSAFSAAVDKIVHREMLNKKIPSVVVAVAHHGVLLHTGAYGLAHVKPDIESTNETLYLVDSMTKQFTAAGIMLLVQDGKLDLDKPVKTYVSYAPAAWDRITPRHLLTHTSGLPHDPQWGYPPIRSQDDDPDRLLRRHIFNQKLSFAPGDKESYSNTGYAALGAILTKVSGMPYSRFLNERIFRPLGMNCTELDYSGGLVKGGARGYGYSGAKNEWNELNDATQPMAAGAIQTTVLDLVKWDAALNGKGLLSDASKRQMWQAYRLNSGQSANYGFGWVIASAGKQRVVWHNGGGWGFNSAIYRYLDAHLCVVVLTNLQVEKKELDHASVLARKIAEAYSSDLAITPSSEKQKPVSGSDSQAGKEKKLDRGRKAAHKKKAGNEAAK